MSEISTGSLDVQRRSVLEKNRLFQRRANFKKNLEGWLFASPWILGFILWTLGPMVASLFFSFTQWDLLTTPKWVGLQNVETMFQDKLVWQSLKVTSIYALTSVPLHITFGLMLALLLNNSLFGVRLPCRVRNLLVADKGRQRPPQRLLL
jgi:ABC-type sugar transport system permease subunit